MTASEISSELGKRLKLVDKKTKSQLQKQATDENDKNKAATVVIEDDNTLTSVVDNVEILLQEDYSEEPTVNIGYESEPERLTKRPTQNKLTNKNSSTQDNKCPWCEYESESDLNLHSSKDHQTIKIVLVKCKTLLWPCQYS